MQTLEYSILINVGRQTVWSTMLDPVLYKKWASAFSPDSQFEGEWRAGAIMRFFDPNLGGTKAVISKFNPPSSMEARHIAMLSKDGAEDIDSEIAKKWIGTTEEYFLNDENGNTRIEIRMFSHPDFAGMFEDSWPKALEKLKQLCESL